MAPKFPKYLKIAHQIGDRRVHSVLLAILLRENEASKGDEKNYNEMIEEVQARVEYGYEIIHELKKFMSDGVLDECLAALKDAEQQDFADMGQLIQMSHAAGLRVGENSRIIKKLKKLK